MRGVSHAACIGRVGQVGQVGRVGLVGRDGLVVAAGAAGSLPCTHSIALRSPVLFSLCLALEVVVTNQHSQSQVDT